MDSTSPDTDLGFLNRDEIVTALGLGALTLIDPARLRPGTRFAYRSVLAAFAAAGAWRSLADLPTVLADPLKRVAFSAGAAGLVYGAAELGEALDARFHRRLERWGVRRPRVVMAAATVALSIGTACLDSRSSALKEDDEVFEPVQRPLAPAVHELITAILEQSEDHDSLRLRAQLATASEEVWSEDDAVTARWVNLLVADDGDLAVPHQFVFPVSARFTTARGVPCQVQLHVEGGRLTSVVLDVAAEEWERVAEDWEPGDGDADPLAGVTWPAATDVTFVTETSGRR